MTETYKSALDLLTSEDRNPAEVRALNDELFELAADLKKRMDQGLAPEDMRRVRGLWEAAEAARQAAAELTG